MNRPLLVAAAGLVLTLAACNNVDKEGTTDKLIEDIERLQNITLDDTQRECVGGLVDERSDDELRDLASDDGDQALEDEFAADLEACLRGTDTIVVAGTDSTAVPGEQTTTTTVAGAGEQTTTSAAG